MGGVKVNPTTSNQVVNSEWEGMVHRALTVAACNTERQTKTFKLEKMAEYIEAARSYAQQDVLLFERICQNLNCQHFQQNQRGYLESWKARLERFDGDDALTTRTNDAVYDFFHTHFIWW